MNLSEENEIPEIEDMNLSKEDEIPEIEVYDINIPGIDIESVYDLYNGEMYTYLPLLRSFISSLPAAIDKIRNVSEEKLYEYSIAVHGLKGICAAIGADELREKANVQEKRLKVGDVSWVLTWNEELIKDTEKLLKDIQAWLYKLDGKKLQE